jgi:hypothetical protein
MAGVVYDGIGGVRRVIEAGNQPDDFAVEVLTFHAAVEREIELVLERLLPRGDVLFTGSPKLNFGHKAKVLNAAWRKNPADAEKLAKVLHAFQSLRDAVAHSDRQQIKSCNAGLMQAYRQIAPEIGDEVPIQEVAQGICLFLADGSTVAELKAVFEGLDRLANRKMPRATGASQGAARSNRPSDNA